MFPYEKYQRLAEPFSVYYSEGQDSLVHLIIQSVEQASQRLMQLLDQPGPNLQVILVAPDEWHATPRDDPDEPGNALPYWTNVTHPPSLVIPSQLDTVIGLPTQEKLIISSILF